ncbi:hypothetical protein PQR33_31435 [Paraburkholderia sediminicola]|uniref:hypothetical protein n=1 Tax=Paraburkholderia sediminicola TaxID=458836 RepID=UPI0038BC1452
MKKFVVLQEAWSSNMDGGAHPVIADPAVVRRLQVYSDWAYVSLGERFVNDVLQISMRAKIKLRWIKPVLRLLDAYASLVGCNFSVHVRKGITPKRNVYEFIGALYSKRFYAASNKYRYRHSDIWSSLCEAAHPADAAQRQTGMPDIKSSCVTDGIVLLVEQFELRPINLTQYEFWRGWPICSSDEIVTWLDMREVHGRFGGDFCAWLYRCFVTHAAGRVRAPCTWLKSLLQFFVQQERTSQDFINSGVTVEFLSRFRLHMVKSLQNRMPYSRIVSTWNQFGVFAHQHMLDGRIFAAIPEEQIPRLPRKKVAGGTPHVSTSPDGDAFITKCLTPLPIEITDEEVLSVILDRIQEDNRLVEQWATVEVEKIWAANKNRVALAPQGLIRHVDFKLPVDGRSKRATDADFEVRIIHASATYEHYKFRTDADVRLTSAFGRAHSKVAVALGLPTNRALLPHMCLLVIDHCELTPSYIEKLRLDDVFTIDGHWYMQGEKARRGPELAEQLIRLSSRCAIVVQQVIEITKYIRAYLEQRNDPLHKVLFLHTGKGFAYPNRYDISSQTADAASVQYLEKSFSSSGLQFRDARDFAKQFSLPALRCSISTAAFIKSPSLIDLSKRLGHAKFNPELVRRYLPAVIERFFRQRWTRVFQTGILVVALKDSPNLLSATGLLSKEALSQFLENHALRIRARPGRPCSRDEVREKNHIESVVIGISEELLTVLMSVRMAVEQAGGNASLPMLWWAQYAERLESFIEKSAQREDFVDMLQGARRAANSAHVVGAVYA